MSGNLAERWADFLLGMGLAVRRRLVDAMSKTIAGLDEVVAEGAGDMIFRIDELAETAIRDYFAAHADAVPPFAFVAEGFEDGYAEIGGGAPQYWICCDPIDGSRCIMLDKRSAFFLSSVAPVADSKTPSLLDAIAAVMVELPTSKQGWADEYVAVQARPLVATRAEVFGAARRPITVRPSAAATLHDGFGYVVDFFPGTHLLAAELAEAIGQAGAGAVEAGRARLFNDQYACTGGQMVELMLHDRCCFDLRPLFFEIEASRGAAVSTGLCCHPYDCAGALVARSAGVIITDGFGAPLNPTFGVHEPVHWCGYANSEIRARIEPIVQQFLAKYGIHSQ